jgi:hypothetical protein
MQIYPILKMADWGSVKAAGIWEPQAQQRLRRGWQQDENAEPGPKMLFSGILRR